MGKSTKRKSTNPVPKPKGSRSTALLVVGKQKVKKGSNLPGRTLSIGKIRKARVTSAPAAVNAPLPSAYLEFMPSAPGTLRVRGRENVGRLTTSSNFTLKENLSVNPLNQKLFPRLSAIANCFESWSVNDMSMSYRATCPTALAGSVLAYFDYDPADVPAVSDINVLNQQTKLNTAMWCSSEQLRPDVNTIHANRALFYVQSGNAQQNGASVDAAQIRQDYAGTFRWYASDAAADSTFGGYLFIDFDFTFHVMIPARPVSAVWNHGDSVAVVTNSSAYLPMCNLDSGVGLIGGKSDQAGAAWYTAGGIAGYLDGARQIYEAGEWLLNLRSTASAAAFDENLLGHRGGKGATPLPHGPSGWVQVREDPVESAVVTIYKDLPIDEAGLPVYPKGAIRNVGAAGDFAVNLYAYDVTDGVVDPDFPVTVSGMTYSGLSQGVSYTTTAAFEASNTWNLSVPAGKQYMIRPQLLTGATAGSARTFSDISLTANVVSQNE